MGAVSSLSAYGGSYESIRLTAPLTSGTYYYGACVDPVPGESDTGNNCSRAVPVHVFVSSGLGFAPPFSRRTVSGSGPASGAGTAL